MNAVMLMGRLTREPEIKKTQDNTIARYTLAVDRRFGRSEQTADFIPCVAFGRCAEFAEMYLHQGTKIAVRGRIQTGSYTKQDGTKVYTTDIIVDEQEFAESKGSQTAGYVPTADPKPEPEPAQESFMDIPDEELDNLPFH